MATSQNGWTALESGDSRLYTWTVPGTVKTKLRLREGPAGFLLVLLVSFFDKYVDDVDFNYKKGLLDDWAYAWRAVRGYVTGLSNHSSGTACDVNATDHPLGATGTFTLDEVAMIHRLLKRFKGCIRWGGDYNGRKDPMHFEINRSAWAVKRVARTLAKTPRGKMVLDANPSQRKAVTGWSPR